MLTNTNVADTLQFWTDLFAKLVARERCDPEPSSVHKPLVQLHQLSVVLVGQPSLGGYIDYQSYVTSGGREGGREGERESM